MDQLEEGFQIEAEGKRKNMNLLINGMLALREII